MKRNKIVLGIGIAVAVLALTVAAFAVNHVALLPSTATLNIAGPTTSMTFDAFCNFSPCNITWILIQCNSDVGTIDNTSGPQTTFTVGGTPGSAHIIASDGHGHTAQATIAVQ